MNNIESGGVYRITNLQSGTVLDLSKDNNVDVIGYDFNGGENQLWRVTRAGFSWTFKNIHSGRFLSFNGGHADGIPVIGSPRETQWELQPYEADPQCFIITVSDDPSHVILYFKTPRSPYGTIKGPKSYVIFT